MKLSIRPDNLVVDIEKGGSLLEGVRSAGINLASSCGGKGTCGKCKVELVTGNLETKASMKKLGANEVLSCQSFFTDGDVTINIPNDGRRLSGHKVLINEISLPNPFGLEPLFRRVVLRLPEPSLDNNIDDLSRLLVELKREIGIEDIYFSLEMMQKLPRVLREGSWTVTVGLALLSCTEGGCGINGCRTEIIELEPGEVQGPYYGLAVDIGTTTVKVNLVDLTTGETVASGGEYNLQQRYGDDVINRIVYSTDEKDGLNRLQQAALTSINNLVQKMLSAQKIKEEHIYTCVVAGNTTMAHLFLGIPANNIRLEPYIPAASLPYPVKSRYIGLAMNPNGFIYTLPAVGSYVGGDITSGVLATRLSSKERISLLIDIGTNGEMVLGNSDWQISCACSAGPCFEGGGIKYGMRAMDGAIDKVDIGPDYEITVNTINDKKPQGICGSGLIDIMSTFLKEEIIGRTGKFDKNIKNTRLRLGEEGWEFVLVWGKDTEHGNDIVILETDIDNVIRAKGAIFGAIRVLMKNVGMTFDNVSEILIAGGFGNSLNIKDAITIGMLPDVPLEKYRYVGNTSLKGAQMSLTSVRAFEEVKEMSKGMTYLDLSVGNDFMEEFVSALFLPHTDFTLFKSVAVN
ncbi:MAG: ASKHA domain-containing protein [Eubacteriales bacterium]